MSVLLDTHVFLWFVFGDHRISARAREVIEDPRMIKLFSIASAWEIAIKLSLGKLAISQPLEQFFAEQFSLTGVSVRAIELPHVVMVSQLPMHRRDPFDRVIVAQALVDGVPLISDDGVLDAYGIERIWQQGSQTAQTSAQCE